HSSLACFYLLCCNRQGNEFLKFMTRYRDVGIFHFLPAVIDYSRSRLCVLRQPCLNRLPHNLPCLAERSKHLVTTMTPLLLLVLQHDFKQHHTPLASVVFPVFDVFEDNHMKSFEW